MQYDLYRMVLPLPYSMFLKEQGVKQQSLFYWEKAENGRFVITRHPQWNQLLSGHEVNDLTLPPDTYSAFLFDELYYALMDSPLIKKQDIELFVKFRNRVSPLGYTIEQQGFATSLLEYIIYVDGINERTSQRIKQKMKSMGHQAQFTNLKNIPHGKTH